MTQQRTPARYPTGGDYVDALQLPGLAFTDPQLKAGTVKTDDFGMPEPVSGNFASVFQILGPAGERWAIKCFVRPDPDRHRRYHAIATALQALHNPALVDFDYQDSGVMVAGVRYPLLKMRWVEAQSLMPWLESNRSHPERLLAVAAEFADVVTTLERAGIAHGDLQHGNLLVTGRDELKLIDYDGMYVPEIAGLPPNEKGLVNYQHPRRGDSDYGPGLDRFSAWVIYTCLIALAAHPDLWRRLRSSDDDTKLLFASADYLDPAASDAFRELRAGGPPHLSFLADQLATFARLAPAQVPALEAVPVDVAASSAPTVHAAASTEVPDWLVDHLPAPAPVPSQRPHVGTTVSSPTYSFAGTHLVIARIAAALTMIAAATGVVALLGVAALAVVPMVVWFIAAVAGAVIITGTYRSHPLIAARREAGNAYAKAQGEVAEAEAELRQVQQLVGQLDTEKAAQRQVIVNQRDIAARQRDAATAQAQQALQQSLLNLQQQRSNVSNTQHAREQARLADIATEYVQRALSNAVIAKNPPRMIDAKLAAALAQHGFRNAADFMGYRTASGYGRYDRTFIKRDKTDYGTYVENVGEKRAQSLLQWRESVKTHAESRAPRTLTPQQRREVVTQLQQFHAGLDTQEDLVKKQARAAIDQARATEQAAQSALDRQQQQIENDAKTKRANLERRTAGAESTLNATVGNAEYLYDALTPLLRASAPNYLRAAVGAAKPWTR